MKIVLAALLAVLQVEFGFAAYSNPQVMEKVVKVRQAGWTAGDLPNPIPDGVIGFAARADCDEIGRYVWLCHESEGCAGPYIVADCANRVERHDERMRRKGIVVEVGWNTAKRWGILGRRPQDNFVAVISLKGE